MGLIRGRHCRPGPVPGIYGHPDPDLCHPGLLPHAACLAHHGLSVRGAGAGGDPDRGPWAAAFPCGNSWMYRRRPDEDMCSRPGGGIAGGPAVGTGDLGRIHRGEKKAELEDIQQQMDAKDAQREQKKQEIGNAVERLVAAQNQLAEAKRKQAEIEGLEHALEIRIRQNQAALESQGSRLQQDPEGLRKAPAGYLRKRPGELPGCAAGIHGFPGFCLPDVPAPAGDPPGFQTD